MGVLTISTFLFAVYIYIYIKGPDCWKLPHDNDATFRQSTTEKNTLLPCEPHMGILKGLHENLHGGAAGL